MAQKAVEVILARQLADYLSTPMFLVDPAGTLIFYNETAEALLGRRFQETGEMPVDEWSTVFSPTDENGQPLAPQDLPLVIALQESRPAYRVFWIRGMDRLVHRIEVTALPLISQTGALLGALALFWESKP